MEVQQHGAAPGSAGQHGSFGQTKHQPLGHKLKTQPCRYFQQGRCNMGERRTFIHGTSSLTLGAPNPAPASLVEAFEEPRARPVYQPAPAQGPLRAMLSRIGFGGRGPQPPAHHEPARPFPGRPLPGPPAPRPQGHMYTGGVPVLPDQVPSGFLLAAAARCMGAAQLRLPASSPAAAVSQSSYCASIILLCASLPWVPGCFSAWESPY